MKNILLLVHADGGQEARLQAALDIARAFDGHLTCVDVALVPEAAGSDYWGAAGTAMLVADERQAEAANRDRLEERLRHEDVAWSWIDRSGDMLSSLTAMSRLSELIVVNCEFDAFPAPDMRNLVAGLLRDAHKPVLAVPANCRGFKLEGRAVVAWDGSRAADAALQAAIPLLQRAADVTLLEVVDGTVRIHGEEAAALLSRHGIAALVARELAGRRTAEDVILEHVRRCRADYLVMGGYGRSATAEMLFGGTTRALLGESPVPLLLAH